MSVENSDRNVLRGAPGLRPEIDAEATPVVRQNLQDEATSAVARPAGSASGALAADEATAEVRLAGVSLPRTGLEELDTALGDLETALANLSVQERRLLAVVALTFVSLFMPWFQVWTHGPGLPTTPRSGLELVGLSAMVLIVSLIAALLAKEAAEQLLWRQRSLAIRALTALLALRLGWTLLGAPEPALAWRHSFWSLIPASLCVALVMALMGRLPAWPRRLLPPR